MDPFQYQSDVDKSILGYIERIMQLVQGSAVLKDKHEADRKDEEKRRGREH